MPIGISNIPGLAGYRANLDVVSDLFSGSPSSSGVLDNDGPGASVLAAHRSDELALLAADFRDQARPHLRDHAQGDLRDYAQGDPRDYAKGELGNYAKGELGDYAEADLRDDAKDGLHDAKADLAPHGNGPSAGRGRGWSDNQSDRADSADGKRGSKGSVDGLTGVTSTVPEPNTLILLGAGFLGAAMWTRRRGGAGLSQIR